MGLITGSTPSPIFTPGSGCLDTIFTLSPDGYAKMSPTLEDWRGGTDLTVFVLSRGIDPTCYPPRFYAVSGTASVEVPFYQSATCPSGYSAFTASFGLTSATRATCCPTIFDGDTLDTALWKYNVRGVQCTYEATSAVSVPVVSSNMIRSMPISAIFATGVVVMHEASHLPYWTTPTAASVSDAASSIISDSTSSDSASSITPPLAIGVSVGVAAFIGFSIFAYFLWRSGKRSESSENPASTQADLHSSQAQLGEPETSQAGDCKAEVEDTGTQIPIYELPSPDQARHTAELDGDWRGTEAAALIEIDLSRPQRAREAAKVERLEQSSETS